MLTKLQINNLNTENKTIDKLHQEIKDQAAKVKRCNWPHLPLITNRELDELFRVIENLPTKRNL